MCDESCQKLNSQRLEIIDELDDGIRALRGFIDLLDSADLRDIQSSDLHALARPILLQFQLSQQLIQGKTA